MPNHVTNIVKSSPRVISAMVRSLTDEEKDNATEFEKDSNKIAVDFGLLIPQPDYVFRGNCDHRHPHVDKETGKVYSDCWLSWNRQNWGTKWNAYSAEVSPVAEDGTQTLKFETAWSHPVPVMEALTNKFPDEQIEVKYADEDFGYNVGLYQLENREVIYNFVPVGGSEEAEELAAQIIYNKTYAEMKQEWDQDDIESARLSCFAHRLEKERGVENGHTLIRKEKLEVPEDIVQSIYTKEQADAYWRRWLAL